MHLSRLVTYGVVDGPVVDDRLTGVAVQRVAEGIGKVHAEAAFDDLTQADDRLGPARDAGPGRDLGTETGTVNYRQDGSSERMTSGALRRKRLTRLDLR